MPIPSIHTITLPLLRFVEDEKEHSSQEVISHLEQLFQLTEEEKRLIVPSGVQRVFVNRVAWARVELKMACLIESTRSGYFKISSRGKEAIISNPEKIDRKFLLQYPEYKLKVTKVQKEKNSNESLESDIVLQKTPDELIAYGYEQIRNELANELVEKIKSCSPAFFEKLVLDVLLKMGYGGSSGEFGKVLGRVGDEGIDGIIKEDRLGLDVIYIQAKRWEGTVGRPEIQKFVGALQGQRAKKGVFITTSAFSNDAKDFVSKIETKVVLISGNELAELMIDYGVGVAVKQTYEIKKVDSDYFSEE